MKIKSYLLACILLAIALTVFAMPVSADLDDVPQGGTVLLGESGLDVTAAVGDATFLGWWENSEYDDAPTRQIDLTGFDLEQFNIDAGPTSPFVGTEGKGPWWRLDSAGMTNPTEQAFSVVSPQATMKIWNMYHGTDATNGTVLIGDEVDFGFNPTNLQYIFLRDTGAVFDCKIVVRSPGGVIYSKLWTDNVGLKSLTDLPVDSTPWWWSSGDSTPSPDDDDGWDTDYVDEITNYPVYSPGTYQVWVECNENELGFVSTTWTVTLEEEQPILTVNPPTLIRGGKFYTTVKGIPNAKYIIWIQGCPNCPGCCHDPMSGKCCDQPPMIVDGQEGVCLYLPNHNCSKEDFGMTKILDCGCACTNTVRGIVPDYPDDGYYYALVTLDENGERTIEWQTTTCTEATTYKIHTQRWIPDDIDHLDLTRPFAEACVIVQKGVVTLNTEVCGQITSTSYLGETVRIFGTNTDSKITYLFITGPCQACPGENMTVTNEVEDGNPNTFTKVMVKSDNTWEYYWETRDLSIDLGQYTIYAASMPNDAQALEGVPCIDCEPVKKSCAAWAKKPFTFLEPTIFADIHPKILRIVCCLPPDIIVSGTATGLRGEALLQDMNGDFHSSGLQFFDKDDTVPLGLWVFGENKVAGEKYIFDTIFVDCPTGNFSANIKNYVDTLALQPGTYTVIVQHPMYNHRLDIIPEDEIAEQSEWYWWWKFLPTYMKDEVWYPDANKQFVVTATPVRWSKLFVIDGPDRLVGTQALNALLIGFQNPNIDDHIVTLTFKVESNTALVADFSGSPQTGAAPLAVQFTDISLGNPTSWSWAFGDGETSNVRNPQHTYAGPGTYNVGLMVANAGGSSSITKNAYITVTGVTPTVTPTVPPVNPNQINLMTGWNFVSTPMTLADGQNTVGTVFASVNTGGRSIYLYDASTGLWDAMAASDPFVPLDGIWIYSTTPKQVTLTFKSGGASTPPTKNVYEGWNAVGFSGADPRSAAETFVTVNDPPRKNWAQAIGWNAASQAYRTPIANVAPANTAQLFPTNGYWLFMNGENAPWVLS